MLDQIKLRDSRVNVLYVDPGIGGTGYAFYPFIGPVKMAAYRPSVWGVLHGDKRASWKVQVSQICADFSNRLIAHNPRFVVLEFPTLWTSGKSQASASQGDLFKLTYLIGGLAEAWRISDPEIWGRQPELINPHNWKGQLPKAVVIGRIKKHLQIVPPDHAADAIGMGLAAQGLL